MMSDRNDISRNKRNRVLGAATIFTLVVGSIVYHYVEGWGWIDSIYFSVITLTTVGYGDFSPQTDIGKIFTIFYVVTGIGLMFTFINDFFNYRVKIYKKKSKNVDD